MRVLHILSERGFSGGEGQLQSVVRALRAAGHENLFVLQPGAAFEAEAAASGRVVGRVRMRNSLDLAAVLALRPLLRQADLVHLADSRAHKLGLWAATGARDLPPLVVTRRMDYAVGGGPLARRLYGPRVAAVVAVSAAVAAAVAEAGVPAERLHVIHDGVEAALADDRAATRAGARAAFGFASNDVVVLAAASLRPRKGQRHLLAGFARVADEFPSARLVLAGEGSERDALAAQIERLGLEARVQLPGHMDVRSALAAADIACIPSLMEGLSVFSLEAQLFERPVIASRVGGLTESVADGVTGRLVAPGDAAALGAALRELLADVALRARWGAAGRARVLAQFTATQMARRTVALYESLLAP
ncbi:MAG: glycosyltransferase family 4 protein [Planctomycetota bacterium]|nr:glycosyltransferase family 4 protein [Planctomycetota bacterium]